MLQFIKDGCTKLVIVDVSESTLMETEKLASEANPQAEIEPLIGDVAEVDFVADNPGLTLFHCHQQLHMDFGFMTLFDYV